MKNYLANVIECALHKIRFDYEPDVLRPGLAVNRATSTIFTANCIFDSRCIHLRTIENGPLWNWERKCIGFFSSFFV